MFDIVRRELEVSQVCFYSNVGCRISRHYWVPTYAQKGGYKGRTVGHLIASRQRLVDRADLLFGLDAPEDGRKEGDKSRNGNARNEQC